MAVWRIPGVAAATTRPREDRRGLAIGLMIMGFLMFTALDTAAKLLVTSGVAPSMAAFLRYIGHMSIVTAMIVPVHGMRSLNSAAPWREILRAVFLCISTLLNFTAVLYLPLTLTATIFFTMPMFVCALSVPFLGEKVGPRRWGAIAVGFVGIVVVTQPWTADFHWATLLSLGAAFMGAGYMTMTRMLAGVDSSNTQQLYASTLAVVALAPIAAFNWSPPEGLAPWLLVAAMGAFGWGGHQMITTAHRYAPASVLAPFIYLQLVFMTASSWAIFDQPPSISIAIGAPVVVASGLYIWWRERNLTGEG